jgi:hypothetical protein
MKKFLPLFFFVSAVCAQDVIQYTDGSVRTIKIAAVEGPMLRIVVPSPVPGQPGGSTLIPRAGISKIIFGPDPVLDAVAASPALGSLSSARSRWQNLQTLLGMPESRAGEAGCLYGEILLQTDESARHDEALEVFKAVETGTWNPEHRQRATRGRLNALIKKGQLEEASQEAEQIERSAEDPGLVIDTRLLLAGARKEALNLLLSENPRWNEDPPVRAERQRLIHEGVEYALYPFLFHGTKRQQAARGLWLACEIYQLAGQDDDARAVAGDLTEIYSETPEAAEAAALEKEKS